MGTSSVDVGWHFYARVSLAGMVIADGDRVWLEMYPVTEFDSLAASPLPPKLTVLNDRGIVTVTAVADDEATAGAMLIEWAKENLK